ncbi:cobyrinate a,c-diamide synthase [Ectothiorhodospiraceae bacterium WFHF3C12]|nr:cobyrinate a,c-diamide synthase [Ectothiorhodospiraceae bacterium WFHF3C12]
MTGRGTDDNAAVHAPAVLIAAPSSSAGKTTLTAALARYHRDQGRVVRVFKAGPDFLDPMIHREASSQPVYNLDLWMVGEAACRQLLFEAAGEADLIIIECGMGLYDGTPSSADLAEAFGVPVLAVIDARAMAQTFGAVAHGLATYRPGLPFAGVLANRVASPGHDELLRESVPEGMHYFGGVRRNEQLGFPERHLGVVQALELGDLEQRLATGAEAVAEAGVTELPAPVPFTAAPVEPPPRHLTGVRIGIARDAAFAFIYPANLELLTAMGAELHFFSPLAHEALPDVDALWFPGGYPELHLDALGGNEPMRTSIRNHHEAGKPILAECGGLLYMLDALVDGEGCEGRMVGLLPGTARLQPRLAAIGMQALDLPEGEVRGHAFHYSTLETTTEPWGTARRQRGSRPGEPVYRDGRLTASYLHLYFPANPEAVAALFKP